MGTLKYELPTEPIPRLKMYQEMGFVFHGSLNSNLTQLEPREAGDTDVTNDFNNDKAVFAAITPVASILFGCMNISDIPFELIEGTTWSVVNVDGKEDIVARIPASFKEYLKGKVGYVYVMNGSDFPIKGQEGSWQVKSKIPVTPVDKVEVRFEDFERSGGKIIWK